MSTLLPALLSILLAGGAPLAAREQGPPATGARPLVVPLSRLVGPSSPLRDQDLTFDATHAALALDYLASGQAGQLKAMADTPALEHLLRHARKFDYEVPKVSTAALAAHLVAPGERRPQDALVCARSLEYFQGPMRDDPGWVADVLRYLPEEFRFHATLYLTFHYDLGVAEGPTASLNGAHHCFAEHPRELVYYAIHELHHVGFMAYQPAKPLAALRTYGDLARFVAYGTQLEGMAVWAAYPRRLQEGALAQDGLGDYVALQDAARMDRMEAAYFKAYGALLAKGEQPLEAGAIPLALEAFGTDRLWYRVGARMAQRLEAARGRQGLVGLVKTGPEAFLAAYRQVAGAMGFVPVLVPLVPSALAGLPGPPILTVAIDHRGSHGREGDPQRWIQALIKDSR